MRLPKRSFSLRACSSSSAETSPPTIEAWPSRKASKAKHCLPAPQPTSRMRSPRTGRMTSRIQASMSRPPYCWWMLIRVSRSLVVSLYSIFMQTFLGSARLYRRDPGGGWPRRRRKDERRTVDDAAHDHLEIRRSEERRRCERPPLDHPRMTAPLGHKGGEIERGAVELGVQEPPRPSGTIGRRRRRGGEITFERSAVGVARRGQQIWIDLFVAGAAGAQHRHSGDDRLQADGGVVGQNERRRPQQVVRADRLLRRDEDDVRQPLEPRVLHPGLDALLALFARSAFVGVGAHNEEPLRMK